MAGNTSYHEDVGSLQVWFLRPQQSPSRSLAGSSLLTSGFCNLYGKAEEREQPKLNKNKSGGLICAILRLAQSSSNQDSVGLGKEGTRGMGQMTEKRNHGNRDVTGGPKPTGGLMCFLKTGPGQPDVPNVKEP